jgi:hypothetical protein
MPSVGLTWSDVTAVVTAAGSNEIVVGVMAILLGVPLMIFFFRQIMRLTGDPSTGGDYWKNERP